MTFNNLFASWAGIASALGNHLWQSTLFALAAGLLTLILRKNSARARYCLWMAASAKFLIPFSFLVGFGSYLGSPKIHPTAQPVVFLVQQFNQPFSPGNPAHVTAPVAWSSLAAALRLLPILFLVIWLCGCAAVLSLWWLRWRRLTAATRGMPPAGRGREFDVLRRVQKSEGFGGHVELIISVTGLEPGILGIRRPILVLPAGISNRLTDAQLEAIITHELCHARSRDNLAAAVHMLVEALFWFHPLVWWIGARLVDERERTCDEEVLSAGSDPQVYAESILKVCEFYLESPLFCAAGVTGSNLKKRIEAIMMNRIGRKLEAGKKLLLATAGIAAVAGPLALGLLDATQGRAQSPAQEALPRVPVFESAIIKPNNGEPMAGFTIVGKPFKAMMWKGDRLMATNFTLHGLIGVAYDVPDDQILGGPDWLNTEGYDLDVKMGKALADEMQQRGRQYGVSGRTLMLEKLLSDRFKLSFHRETKDLTVYALVVAANGPKLQRAKPGDTYPNGLKKADGSPLGANILSAQEGKLIGQGIPIASLAKDLSGEYYLHRTVLDKTELTDKYDFTLQWAPEESQPAILAAVQEQLGLKLEPQTARVEVLVIDHAKEIKGDESSKTPPQAKNLETFVPAYKVASVQAHTSGNDLFKMTFDENGFSAINVTLRNLIRAAYGVEESRVFGAPNWVNSEKYDVDARLDPALTKELYEMSEDRLRAERRRMLQALLADRFKLALHRGTKQIGTYVLVFATNGPNFREGKPGNTYPNGIIDNGKPLGPDNFKLGRYTGGRGEFVVQGMSMAKVVRLLSENILDCSVMDNTGLTGNYDLTLQWKIGDESQGPMFKTKDHQPVSVSASQHEFSGPSFFTAIQEQLGLRLESGNSLVEALVIDHAEKPSEN